jgi:hypothetical protein
MKNQIVQSLKVIVLALVLSLGLSFVFAQTTPVGTWNPPSAGPSSASNTEGPINTGSAAQTKVGPLVLNDTLDVGQALTAFGGISTTVFHASGNSLFQQDVGINQDTNIGQNLTVDQDSLLKQEVTIGSNLILDSFNETSFERVTPGERSLCVSGSGKVILCSEAKCGTAHSTYTSTAPGTYPETILCATGSTLSGSVDTLSSPPEFRWTCVNANGNSSCFATKPAICGSSSGTAATYNTPTGASASYSSNLCGAYSFLANPPPPAQAIELINGIFKWKCGKGTNTVNCQQPHQITSASAIATSELGCTNEAIGSGGVRHAIYSFRVYVTITPKANFSIRWIITDLDDNNNTVYDFVTNGATTFQAMNNPYAETGSIPLEASKFANKRNYYVRAIIQYGANGVASNWVNKTLSVETMRCDN